MKVLHDFHVHTHLSSCAKETATVESYVENAKRLGLKKMGFADHMWDSAIDGACDWYIPQNFEHISLIKDEFKKVNHDGIEVYFGCETEYDLMHRSVAISEAVAEQLDFLIVPNSHTHIVMPKDLYEPHQKHADFMVSAFNDIIDSNVSRYITAIAHPFAAVNCPYGNRGLIAKISDDEFKKMFEKMAKKGIAFEINMSNFGRRSREEIENDEHIRMFSIAKESGCKFIFGSDSHSPEGHGVYANADFVANLLELKETDIADIAR